MRVLVAPCSFKGTLTAMEAAAAMARGVSRALPSADVDIRPLADGGEGTLDIMMDASGGRAVRVDARDPLGRRRPASLGVMADGVVLVEAAQAIGLTRLSAHERDPLGSSSAGVGDLLLAALEERPRSIEVAIGGTATVDGGLGLLHALGARALDGRGRVLPPSGRALTEVAGLDLEGLDPRLADTSLRGLLDVDSPLLGAHGARLYMAQKGASAAACDLLEQGLRRFRDVVRAATGRDLDLPGAGAGGGLGAALLLLGAQLTSGAERVLDAQGIDAELSGCALALTGEGALDRQTQEGKAIARLSARCQRAGVPLVAFCGRVEESAVGPVGLTAAVALSPTGRPAESSASAAVALEHRTAEWLAAWGAGEP